MLKQTKTSAIDIQPHATAAQGEARRVVCSVARTAGAVEAKLLVRRDGDAKEAIFDLKWESTCRQYDMYAGELTLEEPGLYWTRCMVRGEQGTWYVDRHGALLREGGDPEQMTVYSADYQVPTWYAQGVTYQIFVDRFYRPGEVLEKDDGRERIIHMNWEDYPVVTEKPVQMKNNDFFGGNLPGVKEKLPYLRSMGVTAIYLNPVFESASNHKYDTGDYMQVDPMFGGEDALRELCAEAAKLGIRVILDVAFNHTGNDSRYFNAYGTYPGVGAAQSKDSPYYPWYSFTDWPNAYDCWWGVYTLPHLREMEESFLQFVFGEDGVIRHWLDAGVCGYRLDVVDELPREFVEPLRRAVKAGNSEAVIIGEVWEDASTKSSYGQRRAYFQGQELDGVMNYPARTAIIQFLRGEISAARCRDDITAVYRHYPPAVWQAMMNILGTHDTRRIINELGCQGHVQGLDRLGLAAYRMSEEELQTGKKRLMQAAAMLYMLPGSPCIYYGDEALLQGFEDPMNRQTYPWGREDAQMQDWYRQLGALKTQNPILHTGDMQVLSDGQDALVIRRTQGDRRVCAIINRAQEPYHYRVEGAVRVCAGEMFLDGQDGVAVSAQGVLVIEESGYAH